MGAEWADAISRDSGRGVAGKDLRQAIVKGGRNRGFKRGHHHLWQWYTWTCHGTTMWIIRSQPHWYVRSMNAVPWIGEELDHWEMWGGVVWFLLLLFAFFLQSKPQWLSVQFPLWTLGAVPLPFSRCVPCLLCRARMLKDICSHMEALAQAHFAVKTECLRPMVVTRENVHKFSFRQALCNWTLKLYKHSFAVLTQMPVQYLFWTACFLVWMYCSGDYKPILHSVLKMSVLTWRTSQETHAD